MSLVRKILVAALLALMLGGPAPGSAGGIVDARKGAFDPGYAVVYADLFVAIVSVGEAPDDKLEASLWYGPKNKTALKIGQIELYYRDRAGEKASIDIDLFREIKLSPGDRLVVTWDPDTGKYDITVETAV